MGTGKSRIWRTAAEKRRIVELTLEPGMSVSRVAQAEGVNAHQVFDWRRAYRDGGLNDPGAALLPVVFAEATKRDGSATEDADCSSAGGSIHIEIPERAAISVEPGADEALLRTVLELLRK
jgi:transposase